jgi:hypothetical protein
MLCTGYVFVLAMRQAGFNWFVIFSLSGYWALLVTLLVSLYLFAIFRGTSKGPSIEKEHPLTSTTYYMAFYVTAPFLGAIAGILGMMGETRFAALLAAISLGTIGATFLTWVVVDPVSGSLELLTPQARKHFVERIAQARLLKEQEQANRELLLARIVEQEREKELLWRRALAPQAERLATLLTADYTNFTEAKQKAIGMGVEAWRMGGLGCMRQLRKMAEETFKQQYKQRQFVDYISAWWDGIGRWRNISLLS